MKLTYISLLLRTATLAMPLPGFFFFFFPSQCSHFQGLFWRLMTSHDPIFQSFAAITVHFIKYSLSLCETVPMVALSHSPGTPVPTGDFFKGR